MSFLTTQKIPYIPTSGGKIICGTQEIPIVRIMKIFLLHMTALRNASVKMAFILPNMNVPKNIE